MKICFPGITVVEKNLTVLDIENHHTNLGKRRQKQPGNLYIGTDICFFSLVLIASSSKVSINTFTSTSESEDIHSRFFFLFVEMTVIVRSVMVQTF